jgi:hypothetical protein
MLRMFYFSGTVFGLPRAPARNRAYVYNTRAGLRLFGLCLPGASGVAQLLAALVLRMKGYRVAVIRPVNLPTNWISIHPRPAQGHRRGAPRTM